MKIPFDIKYRPQIESGEYKVVTQNNTPVRIICWDANGTQPIVGLIYNNSTMRDIIEVFCNNGRYWSLDGKVSDLDLFIIIPEPELTEFEATLLSYLSDDTSGELDKETMHKCVKARAEELLAIAKKELCKGCAANLEGYIKGRQDAFKEMGEHTVYKHEGPTIPALWPPCHYGGECANPFRDCFSCPRGAITVGINTTTGTSTSKVEGSADFQKGYQKATELANLAKRYKNAHFQEDG